MISPAEMNKILHIGYLHPARSNRLAVQLQYTATSMEAQVINLSEKLNDNKDATECCHDIRYVPNWPARIDDDPYLIRRTKSLVRRLLNSFIVLGWLWRSDAALLHAHENASIWFITVWVTVFRRPAVWDPHDYYHERLRQRSRFGRFNIKEILERLVILQNTPILAVSEGMKERFAETYPDARVEIVNNYSADRSADGGFTNGEARTPEAIACARDRLANGKIRLVYPGLIKPERIELSLIRAIGKIPEIELDIYGVDATAAYQKKIEAVLSQNGINNIHFKGAYASDNVISILADYHFALFPYPITHENIDFCLPNKFFQAIEAGLPLIVTNMKEMGGIINRFGLGFVFPSGDYSSCKEILEKQSIRSESYIGQVRNVLNYQARQIDYEQQKAALLDTYAAAMEHI
jgi:glycosyltransferase involved in cell wall biosynthesis